MNLLSPAWSPAKHGASVHGASSRQGPRLWMTRMHGRGLVQSASVASFSSYDKQKKSVQKELEILGRVNGSGSS